MSIRTLPDNRLSSMKSTKHSLLNHNEVDPQDIYLEESERPFSYPQEQIPYSSLPEPEVRPKPPTQIEMSRMKPQNSQIHSLPNQKQCSRPMPPPEQKSKVGSKMPMGLPPPSTVYKIPSQFRGSAIHVTPQSMSVMPREPYVPPVEAQCSHCQCKQHIPGNAEQYYCGRCRQLNDIEAKFGFFKCGVCHQKVCYPFKTSDHIQCNICYSVNIVPTTTLSSKFRLSSLNESAMVLPKELQEEEGNNINDEVTTGKDEQDYPQI